MANVTLELFLNDVMPEVPGCDTPIALHAIRSAAIEFCERTNIVKADVDSSTVTTGDRYYDLDSPTASTIVARVLSLRINGATIDPKTEDDLDAWDPLWRTNTGTVAYYTQQTPYQLIFTPIPTADDTIDMTVSTSPKADATSVDRVLYDKFREAIANGAKSRLKAMPSKPWSDPNGALYYKGRFDFEIGAATVIAATGFSKAPLRVSTSV